jgi:hypothetical protein
VLGVRRVAGPVDDGVGAIRISVGDVDDGVTHRPSVVSRRATVGGRGYR